MDKTVWVWMSRISCNHWSTNNSISNMSSLNWSFNSPFNRGSSLFNYSLLELWSWGISIHWVVHHRSGFDNSMSHGRSRDMFGVFNIIWGVGNCVIIFLHYLSNSMSSVKLKSHSFIGSSKCIKLDWKCFILVRDDVNVVADSFHFCLHVGVIVKWWSVHSSSRVDAVT